MAQQEAITGMVQNRIDSRTGSLDDLTTGSKTNLVSAINEVNGECDTNAAAIAAEETRAQGAEGVLENLSTTDKTSLVSAVNSVKQESDANAQQVTLLQSRAGALETGKADKIGIRVIRSLAELQAGDVPGLITFDTGTVPAPPAQEESVIFDDGGILLLDEYGAFSYQDAGGAVTAIIDSGVWQVSSVDTGPAAVSAVTPLDGAAWSAGTWDAGAGYMNLSDVKEIADGARSIADAALPRADVVNDLETGGTAKALSAEQGKTLAAQIAGLAAGQAGRGVVRNAYTPQGNSFRVTQAAVSAGGSGYAAGDALFMQGGALEIFIPATVIVTAADGSGAITSAELSMPGSFPTDVSGAGVTLTGGNGAGAAFDITAVSEPNTVLADIPNPAPNDFAFVLEDETREGRKWRYSNLDYNGDGIYNWVPVVELGDISRDFTVHPIEAGELSTNAVTGVKIADGAVSLAKLASVNLTGILADAADYATAISGSFTEVFTSLFGRIRGLHSSAVKKTGDQTIQGVKTFESTPVIPAQTAWPVSPSSTKPAAESIVNILANQITAALTDKVSTTSVNQTIGGTKTFSSAPVIPAADTLPASPSATKPATEKQVLDIAVRKTGSVDASVWGSGTVNDEQGRTWEHNTYNALIVKGSVLGNGRSGAGSRIELDLNIQFNMWCSVNLAAGAEIVFLSAPINLQWNVSSVLGGGSVGTEWIADSSAAASPATGIMWAFPAPMLLEENGKQIIGSKVCCNMAAAIAASGGTGTPGQLYAYGGMRVLADLSNPVLFFSGRMRIGLTRA